MNFLQNPIIPYNPYPENERYTIPNELENLNFGDLMLEGVSREEYYACQSMDSSMDVRLEGVLEEKYPWQIVGSSMDVRHEGVFKEEYPWQSMDSSMDVMANSSNTNIDVRDSKKSETLKVAFRCQSETEVLDDGYRWRKYGKKSVKNTPYPRNYYKCQSVGCHVKKRIERDKEDKSYVITTYEGRHNHENPSDVLYLDQTSYMVPYRQFQSSPSPLIPN